MPDASEVAAAAVYTATAEQSSRPASQPQSTTDGVVETNNQQPLRIANCVHLKRFDTSRCSTICIEWAGDHFGLLLT